MNMLILNASKQAELTALNTAGSPAKQLSSLPLVSGETALPTALQSDCGPNQTWEYYGTFLETLPIVEVSPDQILEPGLG